MPRLFSEQTGGHTLYTRAVQVWHVLVSVARQRRMLTFAELSVTEMGFTPGPGEGGGTAIFLRLIERYCAVEGLPHLTRIVVSQNSGRPSEGTPEEVRAEDPTTVFDYDWLDVIPPTVQDFEEVDGM